MKTEKNATKQSKKKMKGSTKVIIILVVLALVIGQGLILAGQNFFGPFRHLTISQIAGQYKVAEYQQGVLFYGASNFTRWKTMAEDIPNYPVQNHGFGGSTDKDLMQYAQEILYPYNPKIVVFQTGSNDYVQEQGTDEEKVAACMSRKREMFETFHSQLPEAQFMVMSGLLLPGRSEYLALTQEVNRQLEALCAEYDYLTFVDASDMTYHDGIFEEALFVEDGIHLNGTGQKKWANEYIIPSLNSLCQEKGIIFK